MRNRDREKLSRDEKEMILFSVAVSVLFCCILAVLLAGN